MAKVEVYDRKLEVKEFFKKHLVNRRVWACILSAVAAILAVAGHTEAVAVITLVAGALGLDSYIRPKKQ